MALNVVIAQLVVWDPASSSDVTLQMSTAGLASDGAVQLNGQTCLPAISKAPTITRTLSSFDFSASNDTQTVTAGELTADYGNLQLRVSADLGNRAWMDYDYDGGQATVWVGTLGQPFSSYQVKFVGQTGSHASNGWNSITVPLKGNDGGLTRNMLTLAYAGTGGIEGDTDRIGNLKPYVVGTCENMQPVCVDTPNQVYQFHAYGPAGDVTNVYENALTLGSCVSTVTTTYADLLNVPLAPGQWAKAPAAGLFRLASAPVGTITCDVLGDMDGASAPTQLGAIANLVLRDRGGFSASQIDGTSTAALDSSFNHPWGAVVTDQVTVGDFLRDALTQINGYMLSNSAGQWTFGRNVDGKTATVLNGDRTTLPLVNGYARLAQSNSRVWQVRVGGRRAWYVNSDTEVSDALKQTSATATAAYTTASTAYTIATKADTNASSALTQALALVGESRTSIVAALNSQILQDADKLRADASTLTAGQKVSLVLKQEINSRQDGDDTIQEQINLIGAVSQYGDAFVLDMDRVLVSSTQSMAQHLQQTSSEFQNKLDAKASTTQLNQAVTTIDQAMASSFTDVNASIGQQSARTDVLYEAVVTPTGAQAKAIMQLDANGRVVGYYATNDGTRGDIVFQFDSFTLLRPDGSPMFIADGNGVYMPTVTVDTLKDNTAAVPLISTSTTATAGTESGTSSTTASHRLFSKPFTVEQAGLVEVSAFVSQSFTDGVLTGRPWALEIHVNGQLCPESQRQGTVPGDVLETEGYYYASQAGTYQVELFWNAHHKVQAQQRSFKVVQFPSTTVPADTGDGGDYVPFGGTGTGGGGTGGGGWAGGGQLK